MLSTVWTHRELLWQLTKYDFVSKYKGSIFGVVWSLFNPLLLLAIYTFVFTIAFDARWGESTEGNFSVVLFSGLIVHSLFAECVNRAPHLIISNPNYVKRVVFPLDVLIWMSLLTAIVQFLISFLVLLLYCAIAGVAIHIEFLLFPVILLPLIVFILGVSLIFASLGVYLRDLGQFVSIFSIITLFLAPIFYPLDTIPESYRAFLLLNPVSLPVINLKNLMLWDLPIDWTYWAISLLTSFVFAYIGYTWFDRTKRGFSDVI